MRCASTCVLSALALFIVFPSSHAVAGSAAFRGSGIAHRRGVQPGVFGPIGRAATVRSRAAGPFLWGRARWNRRHGLGFYGSAYPYEFGASPFLLPGAEAPVADAIASPPIPHDLGGTPPVPGIPNPPILAPVIYVLEPAGFRRMRNRGGYSGPDRVLRQELGGPESNPGIDVRPRIVHLPVRP